MFLKLFNIPQGLSSGRLDPLLYVFNMKQLSDSVTTNRIST
jgi:hypothetical protein